jgi:hypothetical protein
MLQFKWYTHWTSLGADGTPDNLIKEGLKSPDRIKISFKKGAKEIKITGHALSTSLRTCSTTSSQRF